MHIIVLITWVRLWYGEIFQEQANLFSWARGEWKYNLRVKYVGVKLAVNSLAPTPPNILAAALTWLGVGSKSKVTVKALKTGKPGWLL